jgi:hypothetical protein
MFGQNKPVVLESYGRRRSRWSVPRWLVLLLCGIAIGAGAVVFVQERYLPPRLSADESTKLRGAFDQAEAERLRLKGELGETTKRLDTALADKKRQGDELAASRATVERQREEVAAVVAALPPDPRGGGIEVRAARFTAKGGTLAYDVVLTRERAAGPPMSGVMQLVVSGESGRGADTTVSLKPVALTIGSHEIVRGSLPLPEGFRPRQTTIQVLDRAGGKILGMRVMLIR